MAKIQITMEKKIRICREFEVTDEQLESLKMGENPFYEEMERDMVTGFEEYDYSVCDEFGNIIVDWS